MKCRYQISEKWKTRDIILVMEAIEFAVEFWDIADPKSTITVKMLTGSPSDDCASADRIKNKRFELRLNHSRLKDSSELIKSVMHEVTHIKQYIENGLRMGAKVARYEGEEYRDFDYWFTPWEMEARAMEQPMFHLFEESN